MPARTTTVRAHTFLCGVRARGIRRVTFSFVFSFVLSLFFLLWFAWCASHLLRSGVGIGRGGTCNVPRSRKLRPTNPSRVYFAMMYLGRIRVVNEKRLTKVGDVLE